MKKYFPTFSTVCLLLCALSSLVYAVCIISTCAADFINSTLSVLIRIVLSTLTYILPFSLFELLIICLPLILFLLVRFAVKSSRSTVSMVRSLFLLIGVISLIFTSYIFTLGVGYHTGPLSEKIGVESVDDISVDELYFTVNTVITSINELSEDLTIKDGSTHMPYSLSEMSAKLISAYDSMNDNYALLTNYTSRVKGVHFSTVMSDLRITGIYSFFTGEANINTEYPDYTQPFTAAHELAHQRGISRENEANFVAFLVCISSDDEYIRYSGYLGLYEYLASSLYRMDKQLYLEANDTLSPVAKADMLASNEVYNSHKDSILGKINDRLNDIYLKANGTDGVVTYGYVVRLAVGYFRNNQ